MLNQHTRFTAAMRYQSSCGSGVNPGRRPKQTCPATQCVIRDSTNFLAYRSAWSSCFVGFVITVLYCATQRLSIPLDTNGSPLYSTGMKYGILNTAHTRYLRSPAYNYDFNKQTGFFARWGVTKDDDPDWAPAGPEIADIEISTICHQGCRFCYKSNTGRGDNMSIKMFRQILPKLGPQLTQAAFGLGSVDANPDLWDILLHCRDQDVVPNLTINGYRMQPDHYRWLARLCGAVAVSRYDPDVCYDAVQRLSAEGLQQVNIHQLLAEETFEDCLRVVQDAQTDRRLRGLRSIVFLALKPVGRGTNLTSIKSIDQYRRLVSTAMEADVGFGFDSCSAPMFLAAVQDHHDYERFQMLAEPCESTLFSIYIDVFGTAFPCSFTSQPEYAVDVLQTEDFIKDVWRGPEFTRWRRRLLATSCGGLVEGCRQCPDFQIYPESA